MAGWLSRASSLFQQSQPPPEPFEVECDCGAKVVGRRLDVYQKPACPHCERPVFVLPLNVYPQPKVKSKPKKPKLDDETKSKRTPSSVVIDDDQVHVEPLSKSSQAKSRTRPNSSNAQTAQAKSIRDQPIVLEVPAGRWITPLRLTAAAIVMVSALTISGLWQRHRIDRAKATVAQSADAGMAALRDRDFAKAASELDRARVAVEILGRSDQTANEIRRLSREATTLAALAPGLLSEIVEETLGNGKPGQTEPLRMPSMYKEAWVIFDARVMPVNDKKNRCSIDAPIVLGNTNIQIQIDSPILRKAVQGSESGEPPRVIFAAQLEQLTAPEGKPPTSLLLLNGKTAFLWTSYDTFSAIGFQPPDAESEEQTRGLLKRQNETQSNGIASGQ